MSFDAGPPVQKKSKLPLILGLLAIGGVAAVACCGGAAWFGVGMVTAPRDAAIAIMEQNPEIVEKLGTPLEAGSSFNLTNYQNNNNNGGAKIGFNVSGPKGTAKVDADMKLIAGTWTANTLTAECSDGSTVTIGGSSAGEDMAPDSDNVEVDGEDSSADDGQ